MFAGELPLDLGIVDNAALLEVDQQHLAGLQAPFALDPLLRHRQHAGFGGEDHVVVVGHHVARRAQPVAVERRADLPSVGERDRRRPVPRLHQRGIVFVERLALRLHQRIAGPGLRDQHHHRMRERVAAGHQNLERVVDAGGIRLAVRDQRPHLVEIGPDQVGAHGAAPGVHPVDVAADRVDLAVMRHEPVRVRELPGREGVGGEALVHQRERRLRQRVAQVRVEAADLARQQQPLVDHGPGREGRHVEVGQAGDAALFAEGAEIVEDLLADREDLALERILVAHLRTRRDHRLADHRHRPDDGRAEAGEVGRHVAPAHHGLAFLDHDLLEMADRVLTRAVVPRQETHRDGVTARRRQAQAGTCGPVAQQRIRHLDQAAGAVAHQRIGTDRAAMVEVQQDLQALRDHVVRFAALDVRDEADAARVMLVAGIVEALLRERFHLGSLSLGAGASRCTVQPSRRGAGFCPSRPSEAILLPEMTLGHAGGCPQGGRSSPGIPHHPAIRFRRRRTAQSKTPNGATKRGN